MKKKSIKNHDINDNNLPTAIPVNKYKIGLIKQHADHYE